MKIRGASEAPRDECDPITSLEKDISFPFMNLKNFLRRREIWNAIWVIKNSYIFNEVGEKKNIFWQWCGEDFKEEIRWIDLSLIGISEMSITDWDEALWDNWGKVWPI